MRVRNNDSRGWGVGGGVGVYESDLRRKILGIWVRGNYLKGTGVSLLPQERGGHGSMKEGNRS